MIPNSSVPPDMLAPNDLDRLVGLIDQLSRPNGLPREAAEARREAIVLVALATAAALRRGDPLDEAYWNEARTAFLSAAVRQQELDAIARFLIGVVDDATPDSEARSRQVGLIAKHLACPGETNVRVDFPERLKVH